MSLRLRSSARSDVGLVRSGNEDSGYAGPDLLVVADGMGGHAAGELASAAAISTMSAVEPDAENEADTLERLSEAVVTTSERIADVVSEHPQFAGMGTTLTALAWLGDAPARVAVLHVGDSRAYLLRAGHLTQLTKDHTYVQTLIDSGELSVDEAATHPRRNLLMRAIDGVHHAEPDLSVREAHLGDRYLVCSDGLCGYVDDALIKKYLELPDQIAAVTALVDAALEAGAPDNVTVVIADVISDDSTKRSSPVVVGAAGEPRNRARLPGMAFPADEQPDSRAGVVRVNSQPASGSGGLSSLAATYEEEDQRRNRLLRIGAVVILFGVLLASLAGLIGVWANNQYYIAANDGYVTIFRGVPGTLGPLRLSAIEQQSTLAMSSLPDFEAMQVEATINAENLASAQQVVQRLTERAAQCVSLPSTPGCPTTAPTNPSGPTLSPSPNPVTSP
jgi:protein phosphatase